MIGLGLSLMASDGPLIAADCLRSLLAKVGVCDGRNQNALHIASFEGYLDIVRVLLGTSDVELDARDACGHTALMLASLRGHLNCMRLLIEAGASDDEVDEVERGVEQSPT